ncbi:MAG: TolC family protein [Planctomycetes bacterium]|nr:TolC family protein [Planctomycetota bacterium]
MRRIGTAAVVCMLSWGCRYTGFEPENSPTRDEMTPLAAGVPYPDLLPRTQRDPPTQVEMRPDGTRLVRLTLREAVRLIQRNNQAFLDAATSRELQLLNLKYTRRTWTLPVFQPLALSASWGWTSQSVGSASESISSGVTQRLPLGGTAALSWALSGSQTPGFESYGRSVSASVSLPLNPLLTSGGWRASIEPLVSAERGYIYSQRAYEFNRLELLLQAVQSYFNQLQQEQNIANLVTNLDRARKFLRQAELREMGGLVTRQDVYSAQLQVTNAENQLATTREDLKLSRNAFKIDLGLLPEDEVVLEAEAIVYHPLKITLEEAVVDALKNNPEWLTAQNQMEDARRALDITRSNLIILPQFSLGASYSWAAVPVDQPFDAVDTADSVYSMSVTGGIEIPLDRFQLDMSYQAALTSYQQAERNFERIRDAFVRNTQDLFVGMLRAETTMNLQQRAIQEAQRNLRLVDFRYQRGQVVPIEVTNAQGQLFQAQNQYLFAQVTAKISQLRLLRWIGRLVIDEEGRWLQ